MRASFSLLCMRLGLAIPFLWAGMEKVFRGYQPPALTTILTHTTFITLDSATAALIFGIAELVIGLLLVLGLFTRFISLLACVYIIAYVICGSLWIGVALVWREIGAAVIACGLLFAGGGSMSIDGALTSEE